MEITEDQRKRAETNRLAALAKRKALIESSNSQLQPQDPWKLFKCRKLSTELNANTAVQLLKDAPEPIFNAYLIERFQVRLEVCSPDSFSITPEVVQGFVYPGEEECFKRLSDCLSDVWVFGLLFERLEDKRSMKQKKKCEYLLDFVGVFHFNLSQTGEVVIQNVTPSHYTQNNGGGKACVYKLRDYGPVLKCLKSSKDIEVEEIPWTTFNVVERLSHSFISGRWMPCRPEHLSDEKVDELMRKLPNRLLNRLLPFQLDGVRFGLQRGGRCLIADEMGLGKTLQAIAIASCFMKEEGSILVVCPAVLRFSWSEELERWLPFCLPADIHLVFGHLDNPYYLSKFPKVVVISYTMLHRLRKSILEQKWSLLIVDESHHVRCTKKSSEPEEIKAVLDLATKVQHIILLSGTPSLSRPYDIFHQIDMLWPGLLGKTKYEFAKTYCAVKFVCTSQGKTFQDFSKGIRLDELNVLLKQTVMIRRLKEHVLVQLPPKRRQIIRLLLKRSDIIGAKAATREMNDDDFDRNVADCKIDRLEEPHDGGDCRIGKLSFHELGIGKLSGFREWFSIHPIVSESDDLVDLDLNSNSQKMIIFAHHHKVLDGVQELMCEKGIQFVRIDGTTLARDRQLAVLSFQSSPEVKIAIIGITAGGVGLDFSSAQNIVFLELPQSPSLMLQAEDRAHRRGQTKAVNIYIFCAKDTLDESHWQNLNKSLCCISSTTDGKYDAIQEIAVEHVSYLEASSKTARSCDGRMNMTACVNLCSKVTGVQGHGFLKVEAHDELNAKTDDLADKNGNIDITAQTDSISIKKEMLSVQLDKDSLSLQKLEVNISEVDVRSPKRVSCPRLDKQSGEKDQAQKEEKFCSGVSKVDDGKPHLIIEPEKNFLNQVDVLRFEVSQYTGRVHLYTCIPGIDLRPIPLFLNFRPEDVDLLDCSANDSEKTDFNMLNTSVSKHALQEFLNDWRKLRPIEQRKLLGKPLQLPLEVELCYLRESINHNADGVLKGKSTRRTTPLCNFSGPLPSSAVWKVVRLCYGSGKRQKEYTQGWTLTDEPLCKLCQIPCQGRNAKTPEFFEDLFCNLSCYEEYRIRISSTSLRRELFRMEHGVCSNCHLDCHKLVKHIKPLSVDMRRDYIEKVAPNLASRKILLDKIINSPTEGNAWHADHIVPVYRGGGECRLENMRTLCVACHSDVTAEQRAERRSIRLKAKKQLRDTITDLKKGGNSERIDINIQDRVDDMQENIVDQLILVKVPGSAYSGGDCLDNRSEGPEVSTVT